MPTPAAPPPEAQDLPRLLVQEADKCVKCGLCLPECPTYRLTRDEAESPRGRIALIEALARRELGPTPRLDRHLDNCLLCRRCERVCPSGVKYGELMDRARVLTRERRPAWLRLAAGVLSRPRLIGPLAMLGRLLPGRVGALARAGGRAAPPAPGVYPPLGPRRGRVGLFLGCVGRFSEAEALHEVLLLLRHLGFEVDIPAGQACCGALHVHLGEAERSQALAARNNAAFAPDLDAVVSIATGCGAHLADDSAYREGLGPRHLDINTFLARLPLEENAWAPLHAKVLVHTPCSQVNVLRSERDVVRLLGVIPGLEATSMPGNTACCGAAGSYVLSHAATARTLREPKLEAIAAAGPDYVVSSNVGCALHLAEGLVAGGRPVPVLHPAQLLARQGTAVHGRQGAGM